MYNQYLACGTCGSFSSERVLLTELCAISEVRPEEHLL